MHHYLKTVLFCGMIGLGGCSSSEPVQNTFDASLYEGRPIDTLSSDVPPLNETEAISRGDVALRNNNYDLALYEYIRSLSFPTARFQDKSLYNIGRIHQSRGNIALAEKAYLLALDYNPNNIQVLTQLGVEYSKAGNTQQGREYMLRAVNADQVRLNSKIRLQASDSQNKEQVLALLVDNQSPAEALMALGVLEDVATQHDVAQAWYSKALMVDGDSVKTLMNLGYSYYMSGDYTTAQRFTLAALDKSPDNSKALNNLALIYLAKGEVRRGLGVFKKQMDTPEALNNVGYILMIQGKPDQAIPYLQQAINMKPSYYKVANENLERALALVKEEPGQ
ncbi:Tetratricopeptide repeat-containing protein [Vibrio xiamenensis]|uniref:Tetratricopeptide repeat-containing protein n=1 Tax=Vibrio xiamenensis TaxID=861298 RepID=A0A1G7W2M9_9VIBR|nr:Tetratricopeptide repeat-containing protein [Vibrio xiamenensis]